MRILEYNGAVFEPPLLFAEAEGVLWQLNKLSQSGKDATYEIISSAFWFENLKEVPSFKAETHADAVEDED